MTACFAGQFALITGVCVSGQTIYVAGGLRG